MRSEEARALEVALGIETGADLAARDLAFLRANFGSMADYLYRAARGIDLRRVKAHRARKSVSAERTFDRDLSSGSTLRDAARMNPPPASIVHTLKFTHGVAQAYIAASYGSVVRVETAEELRQTPRGVTADGMGSGNYAMFRCDIADAELVFGAKFAPVAARRGLLPAWCVHGDAVGWCGQAEVAACCSTASVFCAAATPMFT